MISLAPTTDSLLCDATPARPQCASDSGLAGEGHGGGDDHPHCNFAALMQTTSDAITNGDLSALSSDATYQACVAVADMIGEVQIASSCPGGHDDHHDDHHDEEPSCLAAGEPMPPWAMAEMEYISERCYRDFAMCFGNGTTFELMGETSPWRGAYCDFRPTGCFEAVTMCEEVDPTDCEGLTQGACMLFTDTAGEAGCAPSPQGNDLAYAAFTCYNEVWPQWNATYDGPREPSP